MLCQRLIAAVIVRGNQAVQSFGFKRWLPLGDVSCIVQNLDRWGADEIVILCTDRNRKGPDLGMIQKIGSLEISTPLSYGGGIQCAEQARKTIQAGAERIVLDRVLSENPHELESIAEEVGKQALIASIPIIRQKNNHAEHWQYWNQTSKNLDNFSSGEWIQYVSEVLAIDVKAEGMGLGPDIALFKELLGLQIPILAFGGFSNSDQISEILKQPLIAGAVIGNSLNYTEQSIYHLKNQLKAFPLRPHQSSTITTFA